MICGLTLSAENDALPQSQQFEALSHELFQMTNGAMMDGIPMEGQLADIPLEHAVQNQLASTNMQGPAMSETFHTDFTFNNDSVFDFFKVDTPGTGAPGLDGDGLYGGFWSGPSLGDMFDISMTSANTQ